MSCEKKVPFTQADIDKITQEYPTPFYIYDEQAIRENARRLKKLLTGHRCLEIILP